MISPASLTAVRRPRSAARFAAIALILGAAALLISACDDGGSSPATPAPAPAPAPPPELPEPETATYTFQLPTRLIGPSVPGTLPPGVHYAPGIAFVAHARDAAPFVVGQIASDGLKILAEQGPPQRLIEEATEKSAEVIHEIESFPELLHFLLGPEASIELNIDRPCITYAQMIAPSPDWFIGFANVCATGEDGKWLPEVTAELLAYDAGTAEGQEFEYKASGEDTEPREPVVRLEVPGWFDSDSIVQIHKAIRKTE